MLTPRAVERSSGAQRRGSMFDVEQTSASGQRRMLEGAEGVQPHAPLQTGEHMTNRTAVATGTALGLATGVASAQTGSMMSGGWGMGWMDGYGGPWGAVLLVVAIVAVVALVMYRRGK